MSTQTKEIRHQDLPKNYQDLVLLYPPRPIHDDVELANALEMVELLAGFELNKDQSDYLEAISTFVEKYEESHFPIQSTDMSPLSVLRFLMDEHEMNEVTLGVLLGDKALGTLILKGERALSLTDIQKLADFFSVDPNLFIRQPKLNS